MPTSSRKLTTPPPSVTPLAVSAREACRLLSIGMYHLYALMRSGEIRSFHCGQGDELRRSMRGNPSRRKRGR